MSLRDRAKLEGLKPAYTQTVSSWLDGHADVVDEILEMRAEGYSWTSLLKLLRQEYPSFTFKHADSLRVAMIDQ